MNSGISNNIAKTLHLRTGIRFRSDLRRPSDLYEIILTPEVSDISESFTIGVRIGWKKMYCTFALGDRAGLLLFEMSKSSNSDKNIFSVVAESIVEERGNVHLTLNGQVQDPINVSTWPEEWTSIDLNISSPFIETESDLIKEDQLDYLVVNWVELFLSLIFPLLPIKMVEQEYPEYGMGEYEGKRSNILSTRYERSIKNRQACLAVNGYKCRVCKFDFEQTYGSLGTGFIEVHHIIPLSSLGGDYMINPVKDLVPLCSNCHSMIHRSEPPLTIEQLTNIIRSN